MKLAFLSWRHCLAWMLLLAAFTTGCSKAGPLVVEVQGKVTYQGEPITTGMIKFVPTSPGAAQRPATGAISEDGSYQMTAFPGRKGSRPGEYRVAIVAYTGSFMDGTAHYVVPKKYADPKTSGLMATIPSDVDLLTLDFNLMQ